jgi:hypothetical protein
MQLIFFPICSSQINFGLNISVAISIIANLLQLKRWKALVALYKNKLFYNFTNFTFLTFCDPNKFSAFCALILECTQYHKFYFLWIVRLKTFSYKGKRTKIENIFIYRFNNKLPCVWNFQFNRQFLNFCNISTLVYAVSRLQITFNAKYCREREDLCQVIWNIKTRKKENCFVQTRGPSSHLYIGPWSRASLNPRVFIWTNFRHPLEDASWC